MIDTVPQKPQDKWGWFERIVYLVTGILGLYIVLCAWGLGIYLLSNLIFG